MRGKGIQSLVCGLIIITNIALDLCVMVFPQRFNRGWKTHSVCGLYHPLDWGSELHQKEKPRKQADYQYFDSLLFPVCFL